MPSADLGNGDGKVANKVSQGAHSGRHGYAILCMQEGSMLLSHRHISHEGSRCSFLHEGQGQCAEERSRYQRAGS